MNTFPNHFPTVGQASAATDLASHLGQIVRTADSKTYRLVKANAAIAAAANKVLLKTAGTAGTWTVDASATANSPLVAGVVPAGQTGSTGTTGLISGDYFLIQVGGECTPLVTTTATAAGSGLRSDGVVAGQSEAVSATYAATTQGVVFATLLVASSGANAATAARLQSGMLI